MILVFLRIRRWACFAAGFVWLCAPVPAQDGALEAVFPDGRSERYPLIAPDGVESLTLSNLAAMIRRIDAGMTMEPQYSPPSLRIVAAGRNINIQSDRGGDTFIVIDGRIRRPRYPLTLANGEMLIPLETLRTINDTCNFFELRLARQETPAPEATATATPLWPEAPTPTPLFTPVATATPAPASTPVERVATPSAGFAEETPPPLDLSKPAAALRPSEWNRMLQPAAPGSLSAIAVASMAPAIPFDSVARIWAEARAAEAANRLAAALSESGRFQVFRAEEAIDRQSADRVADWVNGARADALIVVTIEGAKIGHPGGLRLYAPHGAGDGRARPRDRAASGGWPRSMSYLPYQDSSMRMADSLRNRLEIAVEAPIAETQPAPIYVLRRVSCPSALVSLGFATTPDDRTYLEDDVFLEDAIGAIVEGLMSIQSRSSAPAQNETQWGVAR